MTHPRRWLASPIVIPATLALLMLSACAPLAQWRRTQKTNTYEAYWEYLGNYPNSRYGAVARERAEERLWSRADSTNTEDALLRFLAVFPDGRFSAEAAHRREELAWKGARAADRINSYAQFEERFPQSTHAADARQRREELIWQLTRADDLPGGYTDFLGEFPESQHTTEAQQRLRELEETGWRKARDANTAAAYRSFVGAHPNSLRVKEAVVKIATLEERTRKSLATRARAVLEHLRPNSTATVEVLMASIGFTSAPLGSPVVLLHLMDYDYALATDCQTAVDAGLVTQLKFGGNPVPLNSAVDCTGWRVRFTCTRNPEPSIFTSVSAIEVLERPAR